MCFYCSNLNFDRHNIWLKAKLVSALKMYFLMLVILEPSTNIVEKIGVEYWTWTHKIHCMIQFTRTMLLITKTKFWIIQYIIVQIKQQHNFIIILYPQSTLIGPYLSLLGCEQCKYYYWTALIGEVIYLNSQLTNFFNMIKIGACLTNDEFFYVVGSNLAGWDW
jgi:hypothetical protein